VSERQAGRAEKTRVGGVREPGGEEAAAGDLGKVRAPADTPPRRWRRVGGLALALGILCGLGWVIVHQWRRLPPGALVPNWWLVAASFAAYRVSIVAVSLRWRAVLRALGGRLSGWQAYRILAYAALGLYVPGKVAMVAARSYLSAREGVPLRVAMLSVLYDIALNLISAALVVPLWLAVSGSGVPGHYRWVSAGVAALGLCLLHPALVSHVVRLGGLLLGRPIEVASLSYPTMLRLIAGYLNVWAMQGAAFWLFVRAFCDVPLLYVADCAGMMALSLCIGLLVVIAPAGLGVREGVLTGVLSLSMPLALAAAIALALRVFLSVGELLNVGAVFLLSPLLSPAARPERLPGDPPCQS